MKTSKTIKLWMSALAAGTTMLVVSSCDSLLNVQPVNQVDAAQSLTTGQGVQVALTGAYDGLSNRYVYGGEPWVYADLLADDNEVRFAGTFAYMDEIWRKSIVTLNSGASEPWLNSYDAINRANTVLSALDKLTATDRPTVEGAAKFIRAATYFELVRSFAKTWGDGDNNTNPGVPLVLTPTNVVTSADNVARASVAAVYAQIINDLTSAESLLPATSNGTRANKAVAAALLSRVYLMQGNYAAARDAANRVIATNRYSLAANFGDAFDESTGAYSTEVIFRITVTEQDGVNQQNVFYAPAAFGGRGDIRIQTKHTALYDAGDVRGQFFYRGGSNTYTSKHRFQYGDVIAFRIAEMYLTRAECNARLGTEVGATPAADVNRIRKRAGLADLATPTVNDILKERKLELAFEGHRLHDLKRTRSTIGADNLPFNSNRVVFPIPQREIDVNKNLVQNPGY